MVARAVPGGEDVQVNRSLLAAIGIPVVVLACAGGFLLSVNPGGSGRGALPAASPGPSTGLPSPSASPSPSHSKDPHKATKKRHQASNESPGSAFVGLAVNGDIAGSVRSFSRATGVHPALVEIYSNFGSAFPWLQVGRVRGQGATPFIQWNPRNAPLGQIAQGAFNSYVRHFARAVKSFGHQIVLSFGHEMNGTWYPWGRLHATPQQFIGAWRHIHAIFARKHVTNVTWSWDPSHGGAPASEWWPGSRYVDWIGIDGYLRPGQTYSGIFAQQLANIRSVTSRPVFIAETAVAPGPGQAHQIKGLFQGMLQDKLMGLVWFDVNRLKAWRLEGRPPAVRAFRRSLTLMGIVNKLRAA
jgi:mannan endo-1,4-beta-mannosidase